MAEVELRKQDVFAANSKKDNMYEVNKMLYEDTFRLKEKLKEVITKTRADVLDLEAKLASSQDELEHTVEKLKKCELEKADLQRSNKALMKRIQRMGTSKIADSQRNTCKTCKQDYMESENFNWSCRTHSSQWSGAIWWCCGKQHKDAIGCKFAKHLKLKESDEDQAKRRFISDNIVCTCCK